MLNDTQLNEIKAEFETLVRSINVEGDIEGLIAFLEKSDFFTAPASIQGSCSFKGGLVLHSLNVYYALQEINKTFCERYKYDEDTIKLVALFHDLYKVNFYESYVSAKKIYSPAGINTDKSGNHFDWVDFEGYKVKDLEEREVYGTNSLNSYMILNQFIPLSKTVATAIVNATTSFEQNPNLGNIMSKCPLTTALHCADMICVYGVENKYEKTY